MNNYEKLGRLLIIHKQCESIFATMGDSIDNILDALCNEYDDSINIDISSIKTSITTIMSYIEEYDELVDDMIKDSSISNTIVS